MAVDAATCFRLPVSLKTQPGSRNITDTSAIRKANLFQSAGNILWTYQPDKFELHYMLKKKMKEWEENYKLLFFLTRGWVIKMY
jgi:hypothetical protein